MSTTLPLSPAVAAVVSGQMRSVSIGSLYSIAESSEPISENDEIQRVNELQTKGDTAFQNKDYLEAIKFYSEALEIDGQKVEVLSARAAVYLEVRQYDLAQRDAEQLVKINPLIPQGHYLLAVSLDNQSQYDKAITSFLSALDHDAEHAEQLVDNITVVASNLCNFNDDVIKTLEDVSPLQKLAEVGIQLHSVNHHDLCIEVLLRAIKLQPEETKYNIQATATLASSYLTLKDLTRAKHYFLQCLTLAMKENNTEYESKCYVNLANIHLLENDIQQSIAYYEKLAAIGNDLKAQSRDGSFPTYWSMELRCALHQNLSVAYKEVRNYPRALHHALLYVELVKNSPDAEFLLPDAHHNAGTYYEMVKDYKSALKHHEAYLALSKARKDKVAMAAAYASLGHVYRILYNFKLAESYQEQYLRMAEKIKDYESQAKALCSIGEIHLMKEDFEKALSFFQQYLRMSRRLDEYETECCAFLKLGDVFKCQGRPQHAQYYYEMAVTVSEKLEQNEDLVNKCRCEVACALVLSVSKDDMEKARLEFEELIPFYSKKIQQFENENIECPTELKTALRNCYDGMQIALCKLEKQENALEYAEGYRQNKFKEIVKLKLDTEDEDAKGPEASYVSFCEDLCKIVNRQSATVLYYSMTDAFLLIWVLKPGEGVVKVQVERAIRESLRQKVRHILEQLQNTDEHKSDLDCENRALPSRDRSVSHLQRKYLAKSKAWKLKEQRKESEKELEKESKVVIPPQRQLYDLMIMPVEKTLIDIKEVLVIPDKELTQVPLDILEDGKGVRITEKYKVTTMPSLAILNVLTRKDTNMAIASTQGNTTSSANLFPMYLDDHLRVVIPPDEKPLSPIRQQLRKAPVMAREKSISPSFITFGTNHYDYVPTPKERLNRAELIVAYEKSKLGTLITHSSTDTEILQGDGVHTKFQQASKQHQSLVIGNPLLPQKLKLHGQIWCPPGELMVSQCEALNVAEYLETKAVIGSAATKDTILNKLCDATLLHIASYGSWEDSVIVIGPSTTSQPNEDGSHNEDNYQIGVKDIMNIDMKAELVILSCCYGDIHRDVDFTLPSALLAAGCKCVMVILWAIPDIAREKFWYHFYKTLQSGNFVSIAMATAKEKLSQDERFTDPMYWSPFLLIGQDVYICVHQIKHAMLDQLVDNAEDEVLKSMPVNALNIAPEPVEVSSQEIILPKLRQSLSALLEHHLEHPKAIPILLQLVAESLTLLLNPQKELLTRKLAQPAMCAPGAIELLNLVGFHFQAKGAESTEPYVVFPHWDHDGLLQPTNQALKALVDLSDNSPCCSALSKLLIASEDVLSGLLDIVSITKHSWEIQLKVTDTGVRSLWGHHICRDFLTSIGFQQVGVLLLFTNTNTNRKLLNGSLHVLAAVLGEKGQAMLDKVDVNYLGVSSRKVRSANSSRPGSKSLKLPSLNPILLSRNRIHMSTPWLSVNGGEEEQKLKIQMAHNLSDVYSEYRYYLMKAHDWHNYTLKPQANQALGSIGETKPKPKVVKVKTGYTASMNRVAVEQESTLTIAGTEQRRDYSNFLVHSRSESILARHKEAARKVYLPYVRKLASVNK